MTLYGVIVAQNRVQSAAHGDLSYGCNSGLIQWTLVCNRDLMGQALVYKGLIVGTFAAQNIWVVEHISHLRI